MTEMSLSVSKHFKNISIIIKKTRVHTQHRTHGLQYLNPPPPTPVHMDRLSLHPKVGGVKEKEKEKEEKKKRRNKLDPHFFIGDPPYTPNRRRPPYSLHRVFFSFFPIFL